MKVLLVNGSPRAKGCTYTALSEVARILEQEGIETEIFQLGTKPVQDCIACMKCRENGGKCVFDDVANELIEKAKGADGFVFGSPVYYAHHSGRVQSVLDRAFYAGGYAFAGKPGASVVSARRGGTAASFDVINKYFGITGMPVVSSTYWNMVYGKTPDEVRQDEEGMQTMRNLARNMAYMLKCFEAGRKAGIEAPAMERTHQTNFIR
ncbi:MAG TPA: flavodoxin family protein [Candidatus Gallimonas intestinigallinarum]|uniref:Flavodoxin family protein n=1 Tax=Candidatus Gallimonas intestinigallinarum TaxID=2838604 RepID=A0A9D2DWL0_9FIRM|nr:flavodoxin family protein [Candidatus Gallimonas intestinigallinarum]